MYVESTLPCACGCGMNATAQRRYRRGHLPITPCPSCGIEFRPRQFSTKYCSRVCYAVGKRYLGQKPPPRGLRLTRICVVCSTSFTRIAHYVRRAGGRFCSRSCRQQVGPKNPRYRSPEYRSWQWRRVSQQAWERDGHSCRKCGKALSCRMLAAAHHVVPRDQYDRPSQADILENIRTLCRPCHWLVHFG